MMYQVFKLEAEISFPSTSSLKGPIPTGLIRDFVYVPKQSRASGKIDMKHADFLEKGHSTSVIITHLTDLLLGNYHVGTTFEVMHGPTLLVTGVITKILGWETRVT